MPGVIPQRVLISLCVLLLLAAPALAQAPAETDPRHFLPADVDAWLRLDLGGDNVLDALNLAARSAALLQPRRGLQTLRGLEQALPLQQLDTATLPVFARDFAPWLGDELLLAWRGDAEAPLLILPAEDLLQALGSFSAILEEQDLLQRDRHQGRRLWLADRSSIAFTPGAVLIGPEMLVRSALDAQAGDAPGLLQDGAGMAQRQSAPAGQILSGWLRGGETLKALAALLAGEDGTGAALPLLQAFSQSVRALDSQSMLQQLALEQKAQALTFSLTTNSPRLNVLRVALTLHGDEATASALPQDFNPAVLEPVPRNAMLVASGRDARPLAFNLLAALSLGGFGDDLLGAFALRQGPAAGDLPDAPDADLVGQVISDWLRALWDQAELDLEHDLLRRLNGSYSLALLPRPNDPLPPLNLPWDLMLVAEVDDGRAAIDALDRLLTFTVDARGLAGDPADATLRRGLAGDDFDDSPLQVWLEDGLLLLGTGAAPQAMQRALAGDNRLIDRARWQDLTRDSPPQLYLDVAPFYATFLPEAAGPQLQEIRQLGLRSHSPAAGRHELEITLTLPDLGG